MNNHDLDQKLQAARVPERPVEYWEAFPRNVLAGLRRPDRPGARSPRWRFGLGWGLGLGFAGALVMLAVWHGTFRKHDPYAFLQNKEAIREMLAMFPNRVRAIVQDERGTQLILSEQPDVPSSPPLWIKICNGGECRVVITFSGQTLQIAKEQVEVLEDAQGQVMLVGDRLFWSATEKSGAAGHLRIQARPLAYAL